MDQSELDVSKIIAELIKGSAEGVLRRARNLTRQQLNKLSIAFEIGFEDYLKDTLGRSGRVKTLLYRDRSVALEEMYVATGFSHNGETYDEQRFFQELRAHGRCIVSGVAGCGKSMFLRHTVRQVIRSDEKLLPIFVELRVLNHHKDTSILHYVLENVIKPHFPKFALEELEYLLKSGVLVLVLDGMDEVTFDTRARYLSELSFLARRYKGCKFLISSRPDENVENLEEFHVFHCRGLEKEDAVRLVEKLRYDADVKADFVKALLSGSYESHIEFASSPLLLTMMLLTFDQAGNIPDKLHIFYNQAFETLFFRHDRLKALYVRKTFSGLTIDVFRDIYSLFCAISYAGEEYSFAEQRCNDVLAESLGYFGISANVDDVRNDLISSFSMLQRDGLYITFVHRTFQEYFAALFLVGCERANFINGINSLARRGGGERCLILLADMARERFEAEWLVPFVERHTQKLSDLCAKSNIAAYAHDCCDGIGVRIDVGVLIGPATDFHRQLMLACRIIERLVPSVRLRAEQASPTKDSIEVIDAIREFFGSDAGTMSDGLFEPSSEDNKWLRGSRLNQELEYVTFALESAKDYFAKRAASRSETKSKLVFHVAREEKKRRIDRRSVAEVLRHTGDASAPGKAKAYMQPIYRNVIVSED